MPIPKVEKEKEEEQSFFKKLISSGIDTQKLDEAWQSHRYIEKYGMAKYLDERDKLKEKSREKSREKNLIQPEKVLKIAGTIPRVEKVEDEFTLGEERMSEIGMSESVGHAILSASIKIPLGFANLAAEIKDLFAEEGLPVNESAVAKLNHWFESTVLGDMMKYSEKKARATATGRITEALGQLVGSYKTAGKGGIWAFKKGSEITDKMFDFYKRKKYIKVAGNKNAYNAAKKVNSLKKMSHGREFGAVAFGGLTTAFGVYDVEDIGTFGDMFFDEGEWTALDRREGKDADDDAARRLWNRVKFGTELGFPIMPFVWGGGKVAKMIATKGKDLAYSNSLLERWVDKWIAQPFRARGVKPSEVAREVRKTEGFEAKSQLIAEDFLRTLDDQTKSVLRAVKQSAEGLNNPEVISKALAKLLMSGKDAVKNKKIYFNGFSSEGLETYYKSMANLGIKKKAAEQLAGTLSSIRQSFVGFKNSILRGNNVVPSIQEFNDIMVKRFTDNLSTDFRIFTDKPIIPINAFKPTQEAKTEVAKIFKRHAEANNSKMTLEEAHGVVDDVIKNVERNPTTKTPEFSFAPQSMLDDVGVQTKNIAENIVGGTFKADKAGGLIQKESDLIAFKKLFGSYQNAKNIIANTMEDFAGIAAKNQLYNNIKQSSLAMTKAGERGLVYPTYAEAVKAFPNVDVIKNPLGLKLSPGLPPEVYKSPLDGMFTRTDVADALKLLDDQALGSITKSAAYRWLVMIPKGGAQVGKTVLGPFTHSRNFFSGAITAIATGNILIPPKMLAKNLSVAWKTIQPQTMYRITGNPKWRNIRGANTTDPTKMVSMEEGGQGLYQFLLDESVVNSSATYRDVMGLLKDIQKGGDLLTRIWDKGPRVMKGLMKWSQDMYVAEDDIWKVFNFLGESYKLNRAYTNALAKGLIKKNQIPSQIELYQEAARVVRNTVPNYAYVSNFVQGMRRSPLGNFVSFPAEIIRTSANIVEEGLKQTKNPIFARNGYEKLFGAAFTWAVIPPMLYAGAKGLYGIAEDKVQAMREMVAPWSVDSTLLPYRNDDGTYGYVDFSHGFFYDTITNPVQAVINGVNSNKDQPLVTGLAEGMVRAMGRLVEPFVSESIWMGVAMDVLVRNGVTRRGTRIFNPREPLGDKIYKSIKHATYTMSPGSLPQLKRLYKAAMGETIKGQRYEIPKELAGFFGFRGVDITPDRTLDFKIQDYRRDKRAERNLIYMGTLTGDPVTDEDKIVRQFILANKQHLETMSKIKRVVDAAQTLGMRRKEIKRLFEDRGLGSLYSKYLRRDKFQPFTISEGMEDAYKQLAKKYDIENPLNRDVKKRIKKIIKKLKKQKLNDDYVITESDWMSALPRAGAVQTAQRSQTPLPPTEGVNPELVTQATPNITQTGLTHIENALLSNEEKAMRLRQRGQA
jgi:hypothetical protein